MADSTTNLDTISASQAAKETTANQLFDSLSPSSLFGRRASTTSGLTFGYYGGKFRREDGTIASIANGTIALTNNATNYLYANGDGVVTKVTSAPSGWPGPLSFGSPGEDAIALYQIITSGGSVTNYTDYRTTDYGRSSSGSSSQPFDLTVFYPGVPTASVIVTRVPVARTITFPASLSGSVGKASVAATAQTDFDVQKNGASVGTMRFAAAATSATFISAGFSLAAGDILAIIAPASPDATLANIGAVLAGTR